jgi:hypothetical protein
MVRALACACLFAMAVSAGGAMDVPAREGAQARPLPEPSPEVGRSREYLAAENVELREIANGGYDRRTVRVKGTLVALETRIDAQYFELTERGSVVVIPVNEILLDVPTLLNKRVEVTGLVRQLMDKQGTEYCRGPRQPLPASYCKDPNLPPTPDLQGDRTGWPRMSITIWSISDISPLSFKKNEGSRLADAIGTLDPTAKEVKVSGQFCGVSLCGAPPGPAPQPSAWLLKDGDDFVWVIGKEPKGKGWRLDPTYAADSRRWLEVVGRAERCGAAWCLRAKQVSITTPPEAAETR